MNKPIHVFAGGVSGLGSYLLIMESLGEQPSVGGAITCAFIGSLSGILPDRLEPPTSPLHREFFHSVGMLIILGYGVFRLMKGDDINKIAKIFGLASASGYSSHLLLDSFTPARIPLI